MPEVFNPATTLRDAFNAVDPTRPLKSNDTRYVDCAPVRGNEDVVKRLFETITWSDRDTTQLFTGHRGSGKSTELLRLQDRLEQSGYAIIYFQADDDLDLNDIGYSDILVAIARRAFEGFQEMGIQVDPKLLDAVHDWFADVTQMRVEGTEKHITAEVGGGTETPSIFSPLLQIMAKVTGQLKTGIESKKQIRQRLDPQITQLLQNINLILQSGKLELQKHGKQGLVIIIDNLDRIVFRELSDGNRNTHDALYIEHGEQLSDLQAHLVYTVPISMFYSSRAAILSNMFPDYTILPMIKVREREGKPWMEGLATLRTILAKRIALDSMVEDAAIDLLCRTSGGHPRDLMTLMRYAVRFADERDTLPITQAVAEKAVQRLVSEYGRMISEAHFALLAEVYRTRSIKNGSEHRMMLYNQSVLEYINGAPEWHNVHPVVLQLPKFQQALNAAQQTEQQSE